MSTYWINFYPKGPSGNEDQPAAYAYNDSAYPPTTDDGIQLKVTVPDSVTVEVVK